jgi:excisionase family DNA binding protein
MSQVISNLDVLTLEEAAQFLRISTEATTELAERGLIPGRRVRDEWRFLKGALADWLRAPTPNETLLAQAGVFKEDESLPAMLAQIYNDRGRPETEG